MRRQQSARRRERCCSHPLIRRDSRLITISLSKNIINSLENFIWSWFPCGNRWHRHWDMIAIRRWQIWICFETATPVRISKPSGKISSRPLRPFTAAIWKTSTGAQKTGISRDMCICWESSLPFRREAGRKHWISLSSCTSRCPSRQGSVIPICSPMSLLTPNLPRPRQTLLLAP